MKRINDKQPISCRYPIWRLCRSICSNFFKKYRNRICPNVFWALAHRPGELRAFWAYHEALMRRVPGLSKSEREMIVVATSAENQCLYCVVAHGAILRIYEKSSLISEEIAINYQKANISERQKVMLDFAVKTCNTSYAITNDDFVLFMNTGLTMMKFGILGQLRRFCFIE